MVVVFYMVVMLYMVDVFYVVVVFYMVDMHQDDAYNSILLFFNVLLVVDYILLRNG